MPGPLLAAWRRTGAEIPFGDLSAPRGTLFEGWYWRLCDPATGRVVVVLLGAMRRWSLAALAAHPGGFVRERVGAAGGQMVRGGSERLQARLGDDAWIAVDIDPAVPWPRRSLGALGPAHLLPHLPQYWHPLLLHGVAHGEALIGGERVAIGGWDAYHEKNWGPAFAGDWWWGQAHLGPRAAVAFAGGRVGARAPTAVVVRAGAQLVALAPPLAAVRTATATGSWRVQARSPRHRVLIEAEAAHPPHVLPVPSPDGRVLPRSHQHLAGRMRVTVRRGRRVLLREETALAGLERGYGEPQPVED